jgi:hypothetical protein
VGADSVVMLDSDVEGGLGVEDGGMHIVVVDHELSPLCLMEPFDLPGCRRRARRG